MIKKYKKCKDCNKLFLDEHNCNNERIEYYHSQKKSGGCNELSYDIHKSNSRYGTTSFL